MTDVEKVKSALKYLESDAKENVDRFSPTMFVSTRTIIAVAEAFRELEQRAEAAEERANNLDNNWLNAIAERDEARWKLAELEKQKPAKEDEDGNPVGFIDWYERKFAGMTFKGTGHVADCDDAWRAAIDYRPAPAVSLLELVPDGWKLVPLIPFPSQWAAGQKAFESAGINKVDPVYKAMIVAAPKCCVGLRR